MNAHFTRFLAERNLDIESHQRQVKYGLTKHTDFAVVLTCATSLWDANDEYVKGYSEYSEFIEEHTTEEDRRYPAWERFADEPIQQLVKAHDLIHEMAPSMGCQLLDGGTHHEKYPISRWAKKTKRFLRAAKLFRQAIAKARDSLRCMQAN